MLARVTPAILLAAFAALPSPHAFAQVSSRPGEVATAPGQTMPPRDAGARPATGTAVIRGRVVDADSGLPVRRASVQVSQRSRSDPRFAMSDDQGRFEVGELPAGDYMVYVRKPGFAAGFFGQRRLGETPRPLTLRDGEVFAKADVSLSKGGVVTGRVVDEVGEPVLEAVVRVIQHRWVAGRKRAFPTGTAQTNDLGVYRVFGLPPGEYLVGVTTQAGRMPFAASAPTEYAPVYYPGTSDLASARTVTVTAAQETLVDLTLMPTPVVRVTGLVIDGSGKLLAGGRVSAVPRMSDASLGFDAQRGGTVKPDGTFVVSGLAPGTWVLSAQQGRGFDEGGERQMARQEISVGDLPIEGVTLVMTRGGTLRGRLVFDGGSPPDPSAFRVLTRSVDESEGFELGGGPGRVNPDGTFEVTGLVGRRVPLLVGGSPQSFSVGTSQQGWAMKAVVHGGRDVQDTGIDFVPGRVANADIVMSREFAELSGSVTTDRGVPVTDYSVLVFSEDREKWFLPSGRWLRTARSNQDGQFKASSLAAGRYLVVAAESFDPNATGDPDELERLRSLATVVTLAENAKKAVVLTLARP